jgi:hypothetical protein
MSQPQEELVLQVKFGWPWGLVIYLVINFSIFEVVTVASTFATAR